MKTKSKYENTENYIKEESSEENQIITEDEDDYNINGGTSENAPVINRRRKLKKPQPESGITQLQQSPGSKQLYSQNNSQIGESRNNKFGTKNRNFQENSYNDSVDRSITNRTPLLEHYQNQNHSLTRGNHNQSCNNQSTSVPRPTIASELKLLKESKGPSPDAQLQSFIQGNSLASFMWNKDTKVGGAEID